MIRRLALISSIAAAAACAGDTRSRDVRNVLSIPRDTPWVFSTMYYNEEGGDPLGEEVSLRTLDGELLATIQFAEGSISRCDSVAVMRDSTLIRFRLRPESGWQYTGAVPEKRVELIPARHAIGVLSPDTLRLEIRTQTATEAAQIDTLVLPRTSDPYRPECVGLRE